MSRCQTAGRAFLDSSPRGLQRSRQATPAGPRARARARCALREVPDAARERIDEATRPGSRSSSSRSSRKRGRTGRRRGRYVEAVRLDTIEDDLVEKCGVDTRRDSEATWLETVKARLRDDLDRCSADVEGDHDEIEEWDFHRGRVSPSVGAPDDEADPDSGYGWMCRLIDAGARGVAGFARVRRPTSSSSSATGRAASARAGRRGRPGGGAPRSRARRGRC